MTRKKTVATAPVAECKHPEETAFNREREDGSGKWDRVCGVEGCGFVMCEVGKPAAPCAHPPFTRNWKVVETDVEGLFCECGHDCGDRRPALGKSPVVPADDPETEAAVQVAEASFTQGEDFFPFDTRPVKCGNRSCGSFSADAADGCALQGSDKPGHVTACGSYQPDQEDLSQGVPAGDGELTSPFSSDSPGPDDIAGQVVATGEGEDHREVFVPEEKSTSYITREPHKVSPRFQEPLPVSVDQTVLAQHGMELAEKHKLWLDTKLKAKTFAKASKEITDKCEREMIELAEIINNEAEILPVDCQWEYDFTEGVKRLRRCDSWEIVREETLTIEERQLSLNLTSSVDAVEKLREIQKEMAGDAPVEAGNAELLVTEQNAEHLAQQEAEAGELVGNGYPLHPDQVGEELQAVQEQANPEDGLDAETIAERDAFCQGWRECTEVKLCMGPENTTGQCYHIVQGQEEDRDNGDPLGAALAEED